MFQGVNLVANSFYSEIEEYTELERFNST